MRIVRVVAASFATMLVSTASLAANPPAAATAVTPIVAPVMPATLYTAHPPAQVSTGRFLLRMRLTTVNGTAVQSTVVRAVPVVVGAKGNKVGFGGKYGPQIVGSLVNGTLSASGVTPGGVTLALTGSMSGGAVGRFSMSRGGVLLGGEYVLDPVGASSIPGETRVGVGTTSGFASMTPTTAGWNNTSSSATSLADGTRNGTTAYSNGTSAAPTANTNNNFAANSQAVNGVSGPTTGNLGPNFGGTAVSGWFSDDSDNPSPMTPIGPSSSNTGSSDAATSKALQQFGASGSSSSSSGWDWSHPIDSATKWWNGLNILGGSSGSGGKEDNPMNDGSHNAGTSGSGLNFGHFPTNGNDKGGGSANGTAPLNRPLGQGDNPFDVGSPADVLNANKLINGASDPGLTQGLAH